MYRLSSKSTCIHASSFESCIATGRQYSAYQNDTVIRSEVWGSLTKLDINWKGGGWESNSRVKHTSWIVNY